MTRRRRIGVAEARRVAMAAQGFDRPRPDARPDRRHFRRVIEQLGLLQLDYVNVLMPAHLLVIWSRLGAYDPDHFHRCVYRSGEYTEQWAHEASIVPVDLWPVLAHRREDWKPWKNSPIMKLPNRQAYLDRVLDQVRQDGAVTAQDLPAVPGPARKPGDWHRSVPRWALEYHFGKGALAVADRLPNFQRVYDLPERVLPPQVLDCSQDDVVCRRGLLQRAASALGIATMQDLADYYRMSPRQAAPLVESLVKDKQLYEIDVEGWKGPAYLAPDARFPRRIGGASLLSPFDPLIWFRPRAMRLFDFHYRIEIYVPESKRKWGYYVLPFRLGDRIVARVDLKADRQRQRLLVKSAYLEEGNDPEHVATALASELRALAQWQQLVGIHVRSKEGFSRLLGAGL